MVSPLHKSLASLRVRPGPAVWAGPEESPEGDTQVLPRTSLARPWNVVVHDDPVTLMDYVTKVFREVFGFDQSKAQQLMLEVHNHGRCICWTGGREQAEIYVQKLQAYHLLATLEQSVE